MTDIVLLPLLGGVLIGLAASGFLLLNGRIAGISGIIGGALTTNTRGNGWRFSFVGGLLLGGVLLWLLMPSVYPSVPSAQHQSVGLLIVAGLLVGFGTRLGSGCTSGHGVCGIARLSPRSIAATLTFITTGALAVLVVRLFGI